MLMTSALCVLLLKLPPEWVHFVILVKLSSNKTEAVSFTMGFPPHTTLQIASDTIHLQSQIKCLGVWWQHNLSLNRSVEDNIAKARHAFFSLALQLALFMVN